MKKVMYVWVCMCIALVGCAQKLIIDDLDLIQASGYDAKDDKIEITLVVPVFTEKEKSEVVTYSSIGATAKEVKSRANEKAFQPLASGQLRLAVYGKKLAEKGMYSIVDTLNRDPSIGNRVYLAIIEGSANEFLQMKTPPRNNIALYGKRILENNMESGNLPETSLHTFMFQYFQVGQDPYLPILKKADKEIKINGLALFHEDKYVSKVEVEDMFLFKSLIETHKEGTQGVNFEDGESVAVHNISSHPKYKVSVKNGKPSFMIEVDMKGKIEALSRRENLEEEEALKRIERKIDKLWEKKATNLVKTFQELDIDPLGLGAHFKQHYREFNQKEWKAMYKDAPITVKYNVDIVQSGVVE
ncbi:Ger(x)C family spore germination protein [Priestia taiwanensis]|uniref:Germination protein n=1 Tax=Priestia taiwanensis TaxID=1347902 RepID=A0A917ETA9_9BACI|nr:Ger(x)C family spore germination protein [Priestia taiwanensis]MBM7363331.1 spore germination protein [Priestia taiwanensis]GGE78051.1 germination protein [Priestia taiwanensis]